MHGVNFFSESCANQASFENNVFYGVVRVDGIDYHVGETVEVSSSPMLGTASQVVRIESLWWEVVNRWCTVTSCDSTVDTSKPAIDMSCRLFFSACGPSEELHATNQLAENLPKRDEVYEPLKKGQWPRVSSHMQFLQTPAVHHHHLHGYQSCTGGPSGNPAWRSHQSSAMFANLVPPTAPKRKGTTPSVGSGLEYGIKAGHSPTKSGWTSLPSDTCTGVCCESCSSKRWQLEMLISFFVSLCMSDFF